MNRRTFAKRSLFSTAGLLAAPYVNSSLAVSSLSLIKVLDLQTDRRINPMGLEEHHLAFSWRIEHEDFQSGWQIQVASTLHNLESSLGDLWDSGWNTGAESSNISYAGESLSSGQQAWWRVRSRDENGIISSWSPSASFEMALLQAEDWHGARWIGCTRPMDLPAYAPTELMGSWVSAQGNKKAEAFKTTFQLKEIPVVSAMAFWGVTDEEISSIAFIENQLSKQALNRVRNKNRRFVDLSFQLQPGVKNTLRIDLSKQLEDLSVCFGMRIVFADGSEQIIRSGTDQWEAILPGGEISSVSTVCQYGNDPFTRAVVFPRTQLAPAWFRRSFTLGSNLIRARLYLSSLGYGKASMNGVAVSDAQLTPPQTDYEDHAIYTCDDITSLLQAGKNEIQVLLDPGWFDQVGGFGVIMSYGRPGLKALLRLDFNDGSTDYVTSDSAWEFKESCLQAANTYLGERVDYRLEQSAVDPNRYKLNWKAAQVLEARSPRLIPMDFPPMRKIRELQAIQSWKVGEKTWLYDLGENITGWIRLTFQEPSGTRIRIRYSEMAEDGKIWNTPLSHWWCHGMVQNDEIISDGDKRIYESQFAFKGFRYFEISGISMNPGPEELTAFEVCTDAPSAAWFESSDPLLNQIYANGKRSFYGNMVNSLVDCPHREKCLWGGDLHASWAFGFYAIDSTNFYRHQVRLSYTGQMDPGGVPGNVMVGKRITGRSSSFNWSVSPLFISWWLYQQKGDLDTFKSHYPSIRHFLEFFIDHSVNGVPHLTRLADHAPPAGIDREAPNNELISAMNFYAAAKRFEIMARALEKNEDAEWANEFRQSIRTSILGFYRPYEHSFGNGTQDSLALAFNILEDIKEEQKLAASLVNHYRKNGHQFDGGFMSFWIYPMLSRYGYGDDALKMMRNPDYPGPAWSIVRYDATTFWESFMPDENMQFNRSLNHHAINHPAAWLLTDLAGIRLDDSNPGDRKLKLDPSIPVNEKLEWVKASLRTQQGWAESSWTKKKNKVQWDFTIPPNSTADLLPPQGARMHKQKGHKTLEIQDKNQMTLGPGKYSMTWEN